VTKQCAICGGDYVDTSRSKNRKICYHAACMRERGRRAYRRKERMPGLKAVCAVCGDKSHEGRTCKIAEAK
jgi:hypothetical protein